MVEKPDKSWEIIVELLESLVTYTEQLSEPPRDSEKTHQLNRQPQHLRFTINSPKDRLNALVTILFGKKTVKLKRGNRSFAEHDQELMRKLKLEMSRSGKTREELLPKYIDIAQARGASTKEESIRERLETVYQNLPKAIDWDEDAGLGFEGYVEEELYTIYPWLLKYKKELINVLKD